MVNDFSNILLDSDITESKYLANCNAEFLGTLERDGSVYDYYLVSNESETYYFYVLRSESQNNC
ncbi:MAG: hypothetical protein GX994_02395 [Firmicutes bacterium]|nr:hypothetical protein [Bacillota bacterium]